LKKKLKESQEKLDNAGEKISNSEYTEFRSSKKILNTLEKSKEVLFNLTKKIVLNVGGTKFTTTKETLTSQENLFFFMFSSGNFEPDENGEYFFDRNPEYFPLILDYLRGSDIDWKALKNEEERFFRELDYFQIQSNSDDPDFLLKVETMRAKCEERKRDRDEKREIYEKRLKLLAQGKFEFEMKSMSTYLVKTATTEGFKFNKNQGGTSDNCGVLFQSASKWSVTIKSGCSGGLMIGVAPANFQTGASQYSTCGHYIHTGTTTKYAQGGVSNQSFSSPITKCDNNNDVITVEYKSGNLSFNINGTNCGTAYTGLQTDLFPAISYIYNQGAEFEVKIIE